MIKSAFKSPLLRTMGIYLFSNIFSAAIPFLLLPYLTTRLTPADYGMISMFQVLFSFFAPLVGYSSSAALSKRFFFLSKKEFSEYTASVLGLNLLSVIPLFLVIGLFGWWISDLSKLPKLWLWAVLLYAFSHQIMEILLIVFRLRNEAIAFGAMKIGRMLLEISLTFLFISLLNQGWEGRVESQFLAAATFATIAIWIMIKRKFIQFQVNWSHVRNALVYGVPLLPHTFGAVLITFADRLFISDMVDMESVGIYTVGYQVGMILMVIQNSFNQAWTPWLFGELKKGSETAKKRVVKFTYVYFIVLLAIAGLLFLSTPLIFKLFIGEAFSGASSIVLLIALGFAMNGMYKSVVSYLFYTENTVIIGIMTLLTAILNIALNYFLIPVYGIEGAALSTLLSFAMQFVLIWISSARHYKMPWLSFN